MVRHLHDIAGGAVLTAPSMADFDNPDTAAVPGEVHGAPGTSVAGEYRMRLFHAIRDTDRRRATAAGTW